MSTMLINRMQKQSNNEDSPHILHIVTAGTIMTEPQNVSSIGFNIPKIKRQTSKDSLRNVDINSRDVLDLTSTIERSYLDRTYKAPWQVKAVQIVVNKDLESQYRAKKQLMKEDGRHARELQDHFAYVFMKDTRIIPFIAQNGLKTSSQSFNSLGNSKLGVYVCRHADIQLRLAESSPFNTCSIFVFKIILGKCKPLVPQTADIEPTPNFDCHISQDRPQPKDSISQQLARSQVYIYEYNDDCETLERPRHCIPHAVLLYEKTGNTQSTYSSKSWYGSSNYSSRSTTFSRSLSSGNEKVRQMSRAAFERKVAEQLQLQQKNQSGNEEPHRMILKSSLSEGSQPSIKDDQHSSDKALDTEGAGTERTEEKGSQVTCSSGTQTKVLHSPEDIVLLHAKHKPQSSIVVHNTIKSVTVYKTREDPRIARRSHFSEENPSSQTQPGHAAGPLQTISNDGLLHHKSAEPVSPLTQNTTSIHEQLSESEPYDPSIWQEEVESSNEGRAYKTAVSMDTTLKTNLFDQSRSLKVNTANTVMSDKIDLLDPSQAKNDTKETNVIKAGLMSTNPTTSDDLYKSIGYPPNKQSYSPISMSDIDKRYSQEVINQIKSMLVNEMGDIDERSLSVKNRQNLKSDLSVEYVPTEYRTDSKTRVCSDAYQTAEVNTYSTEYNQWHTVDSHTDSHKQPISTEHRQPISTEHRQPISTELTFDNSVAPLSASEKFGSEDVISECSMELDSDSESASEKITVEKTESIDRESQLYTDNGYYVYKTSGTSGQNIEDQSKHTENKNTGSVSETSVPSKLLNEVKSDNIYKNSPYSRYLTAEDAKKYLPESPMKPLADSRKPAVSPQHVNSYQPLVNMDYMQNTSTTGEISSPGTNMPNFGNFLQTVNLDISNLKNILQNINVSPSTSPNKDPVSPFKSSYRSLDEVKRQLSYEEKQPEARFDAYCTSNQSRGPLSPSVQKVGTPVPPPVQRTDSNDYYSLVAKSNQSRGPLSPSVQKMETPDHPPLQRTDSTEYDALVAKINNLQAEIDQMKKIEKEGNRSVGNSPAVGWNSPEYSHTSVRNNQNHSDKTMSVPSRKVDILEDITGFHGETSEYSNQVNIPGLAYTNSSSCSYIEKCDDIIRTVKQDLSKDKNSDDYLSKFQTTKHFLPETTASYTVNADRYRKVYTDQFDGSGNQPVSRFQRDILPQVDHRQESQSILKANDNVQNLPIHTNIKSEHKIKIPFQPAYKSTPIKKEPEAKAENNNSEVSNHYAEIQSSQVTDCVLSCGTSQSTFKLERSKQQIEKIERTSPLQKSVVEVDTKEGTEVESRDIQQGMLTVKVDTQIGMLDNKDDIKQGALDKQVNTKQGMLSEGNEIRKEIVGGMIDTKLKMLENQDDRNKNGNIIDVAATKLLDVRIDIKQRPKDKMDDTEKESIGIKVDTELGKWVDTDDVKQRTVDDVNDTVKETLDNKVDTEQEKINETSDIQLEKMDDRSDIGQDTVHGTAKTDSDGHKDKSMEDDKPEDYDHPKEHELEEHEKSKENEDKPVEYDKPKEHEKTLEHDKPKELNKPKEHDKPKELNKPKEHDNPKEYEDKNVEFDKLKEHEKPMENEDKPKEYEDKPMECVKPMEHDKPKELDKPKIHEDKPEGHEGSKSYSVMDNEENQTSSALESNSGNQLSFGSASGSLTDISSHSGKDMDVSSLASPGRQAQKHKVKPKKNKDMMGYRSRKRRRKKNNSRKEDYHDVDSLVSTNSSELLDLSEDLDILSNPSTHKLTGSDTVAEHTDVPEPKVKQTLRDFGLYHWSQAIDHPTFQPRVVIRQLSKRELNVTKVCPQEKSRKELPVVPLMDVDVPFPQQRDDMVKEWIETARKKIKINLKCHDKSESVKSESQPASSITATVCGKETSASVTQSKLSGNIGTDLSSIQTIGNRITTVGAPVYKKPYNTTNENTSANQTTKITTNVSTSEVHCTGGHKITTVGVPLYQPPHKTTNQSILQQNSQTKTIVDCSAGQTPPKTTGITLKVSLHSTTSDSVTSVCVPLYQISCSTSTVVTNSTSHIPSVKTNELSTKPEQPQTLGIILNKAELINLHQSVGQKTESTTTVDSKALTKTDNVLKEQRTNNIVNMSSQVASSKKESSVKAVTAPPLTHIMSTTDKRISPITVLGENKSSVKCATTLSLKTKISTHEYVPSAVKTPPSGFQPKYPKSYSSALTAVTSYSSVSTPVASFSTALTPVTSYSSALAPETSYSSALIPVTSYSSALAPEKSYSSALTPVTSYSNSTPGSSHFTSVSQPVMPRAISSVVTTSVMPAYYGKVQTVVSHPQAIHTHYTHTHYQIPLPSRPRTPTESAHPGHFPGHAIHPSLVPLRSQQHHPPPHMWPHVASSLPPSRYQAPQHGHPTYPYPTQQHGGQSPYIQPTYVPVTTASQPAYSVQSQVSTNVTGPSTKRQSTDVMDWFADKIAPKKRPSLDVVLKSGDADTSSSSKTPGTPDRTTDLWALAFNKNAPTETGKSTPSLDYFLGSGSQHTSVSKRYSDTQKDTTDQKIQFIAVEKSKRRLLSDVQSQTLITPSKVMSKDQSQSVSTPSSTKVLSKDNSQFVSTPSSTKDFSKDNSQTVSTPSSTKVMSKDQSQFVSTPSSTKDFSKDNSQTVSTPSSTKVMSKDQSQFVSTPSSTKDFSKDNSQTVGTPSNTKVMSKDQSQFVSTLSSTKVMSKENSQSVSAPSSAKIMSGSNCQSSSSSNDVILDAKVQTLSTLSSDRVISNCPGQTSVMSDIKSQSHNTPLNTKYMTSVKSQPASILSGSKVAIGVTELSAVTPVDTIKSNKESQPDDVRSVMKKLSPIRAPSKSAAIQCQRRNLYGGSELESSLNTSGSSHEDLEKSSIDSLAKKKEALQRQLEELEFDRNSKSLSKDVDMQLIEISDDDDDDNDDDEDLVVEISDIEEGEIVEHVAEKRDKMVKKVSGDNRVVVASNSLNQDSRVVVALDTDNYDGNNLSGKYGEGTSVTVSSMLNKENMDKKVQRENSDKRRVVSVREDNKRPNEDDLIPSDSACKRRKGLLPNLHIQGGELNRYKFDSPHYTSGHEVVTSIKSPTSAQSVAAEWSEMLRHKDTAVERIKGDSYFKRKESPVKKKTNSFTITDNEKLAVANLMSKQKPRTTLREWIIDEYKELDMAKVVKSVSANLDVELLKMTKGQRKSLKNRVRKEIENVRQECTIQTSSDLAAEGVAMTDKSVLEIKPFEPLPFSRQVIQQEVSIVREHLKKLWKSTQVLTNDKTKSAKDGEGDLLKSSYDFSVRQDMQQIESELVQRINQYNCMRGYPNRRIPGELLTVREKNSYISDEDLVLVMCCGISHKAYQKLRVLRNQIDTLNTRLEKAEKENNAKYMDSLKSESEELHAQRKALMLTFTGPLSKKRISKVRTKAKCYRNCVEYFRKEMGNVAETRLKFLIMTLKDLEWHFSLVTQLQSEIESKRQEELRQEAEMKKRKAVVHKIKNDLGIVHNKLSFMSFKYAKNSLVKDAIANILKKIKEALDLIGPDNESPNVSTSVVTKLTDILKFSVTGYEYVKKQIDKQ